MGKENMEHSADLIYEADAEPGDLVVEVAFSPSNAFNEFIRNVKKKYPNFKGYGDTRDNSIGLVFSSAGAPTVSNTETQWVVDSKVELWCYDPSYGKRGHDKVYDIEIWEGNGQYTVVTQWGRRGQKMTQQVKYRGSSMTEAKNIASDLEYKKRKKGYNLVARLARNSPRASAVSMTQALGEISKLSDSIRNKRSFNSVIPVMDEMKNIASLIKNQNKRDEIMSAINEVSYMDGEKVKFSKFALDELQEVLKPVSKRASAVSSMGTDKKSCVENTHLWNYDPYYGKKGHDKVYDIEVWKNHDTGEFTVVGKWGRRGQKMTQQVKYQGDSERQALETAKELKKSKSKRGYTLESS
jgi:predicted DNA-binding WGR domain protein